MVLNAFADPRREKGDGLVLLISVDVSRVFGGIFRVLQHSIARVLVLKGRNVIQSFSVVFMPTFPYRKLPTKGK